jgi:hypothetical protein
MESCCERLYSKIFAGTRKRFNGQLFTFSSDDDDDDASIFEDTKE